METDIDVFVEDAVLPTKDFVDGGTKRLTFWGGTIGNETHSIAGVSLPQVGERYLLMLGPEQQRELTPVVGLTQGMFKVEEGQETGEAIILESDGSPMRESVVGLVQATLGGQRPSSSGSVRLQDILRALRANLSQLRATPRPEAVATPEARSPRLLPETLNLPPSSANVAFVPPQGFDTSTVFIEPERGPLLQVDDHRADVIGRSHYSWSRRAVLPIVVNQFPSWSSWSPEDQRLMATWNYYSDVFRVRTAPTGTYGWGNNVFDLAGFPSSADMVSEYGFAWSSNTIGVTVSRSISNIIVEADIALNPAFSYTLNDELIYSGATNAVGFRHTMLHELGHMWGAEHNFSSLSVMNYVPSVFRAGGLPYADDTEGIRSAYGDINHTDLGVYFYRATGFQSVSDAIYPIAVTAGSTLTVSRFHFENVGTNLVGSPRLDWYLTPLRDFSTYVYLATSNHGALPRFSYFNPDSISVTLPVPAGTAPGMYYLAAFIRDDGGAIQASFPYINNYAFTRFQIAVAAAPVAIPPSITSHPASVTINSGQSTTVGVVATGTGPFSYQWYQGTSGTLTSPIPGATSSSYTTPALTATTSYWVRVSNAAGSADSNTATVTVSAPPAITSHPASVTVDPGQTTTLSVAATGGAPLTYQWYVGSSGNTASPIAGATSSSYTTPAMAATTSYWVRVSNGSGVANSNTATVSVRQPPFTDATLIPGISVARLVHIIELRTRINALRARFGLLPYAWTDPSPVPGVTNMKAVHTTELRVALAEVYAVAARPQPVYTDPDIVPGVTVMKVAHIAELRAAVIAIE
jgi:hypothetical protein